MESAIGSRRISNRVCSKSGHKIVTLITQEMVDPVSKMVTHVYWHGCEKCGMTVKQLQAYRGYTNKEKNNADSGS